MPDPRPWLIATIPVVMAVVMVETIVRQRRVSKKETDHARVPEHRLDRDA